MLRRSPIFLTALLFSLAKFSAAGVASAVTLTSASASATFGRTVLLTATVSPSTATGKVTFYDGAMILGVGTLTSGQATLSTMFLPPGRQSLFAFYPGDSTYSSSKSTPIAVTVNANPSADFIQPGSSPIAVGSFPQSVAVGDFNGDGKADIAVANQGNNTVTILLGDGNGNFAPAASSPLLTDSNPESIAVGDLNGDGKQDLAVANAAGHDVSIFLGDGHGNFTQPPGSPFSVGSGSSPNFVAIADFNGDGNADLVFCDSFDNSIVLLLGDGKGGFSRTTQHPSLLTAAPVSLAVADFNGDGAPDVAVANGPTNSITILFGDGTGGFTTSPANQYHLGGTSLFAGDLNGDGFPDIAAVASNSLIVLLGDGHGGFSATQTPSLFAASSSPIVAASDFNGDGKIDLAVSGNLNVSILLGDGTGAFAPAGARSYFTGNGGSSVALADFNGDGRPDLAITDRNSNTVTILLGAPVSSALTLLATPNPAAFGQSVTLSASVTPATATGRVTFYDGTLVLGSASVQAGMAVVSTTALPSGTRSLHAYYSGDGSNMPQTSAAVALQVSARPSATFTQSSVSLPTKGNNRAMASGDFNGDGKVDIAVVNQADNSVSVFLGNGAGGFSEVSGSPFGAGNTPSSIVVGDFNNDGQADLAIADTASSKITLLLGNGLGSFSPSSTSPISTISQPVFLAIGDFNNDGNTDLVVVEFQLPGIEVLLGNGRGGFTLASSSPIGVTGPLSVAVGDFNGDGNADLAVTTSFSGTVVVLLGNGAGGFSQAPGSPVAVGRNPTSVAVGDFNQDGILDLAVANYDDGSISILLGNGNGSFTPAIGSPIRLGSPPFSIVTGDFNGDGNTDFAVLAGLSDVLVFDGNGKGGFTPASGSPFPAGNFSGAFTVADFNGDGRPDIAVANGIGNVTLLLGSVLDFFPLNPCRVVDTRLGQGKTGLFGPPSLSPLSARAFPLTMDSCAIPATADAYSLNFTVIPSGPLTFLSAWPFGQNFPGVSTLNSPDGIVIANAAITPAGANGAISVLASQATDLIVDVNGYFAPPNGRELAFYPITPCRMVDTRGSTGLQAYKATNFVMIGTPCGFPPSAQAYSLNVTASPFSRLDFLSIWPTGEPFPSVSTLNSVDGRVIANAAIVAAGYTSSGPGILGPSVASITLLASNATDVIIDANGYFAPPGSPGALHFYPVTPCRVADTRTGQGKTGSFGPPALSANSTRDFSVTASGCGIPSSAQAYVLNLTALPSGPLNFLSIWPSGQTFPGVSTLNSPQGTVIANMAIVPAGIGGAVTVLASNPTGLVIDVNGYFAP